MKPGDLVAFDCLAMSKALVSQRFAFFRHAIGILKVSYGKQ
jgi:hypothetical protein